MLKLSHFGDGDRPAESIAVDLELEDGMELDGLRIIHTPGHSPGHVCIAAGNILLSADHILAQTISQQCPETLGGLPRLGHYSESLDKIQRLGGFETALAAHEQVMTHVSDRIDTIRAATAAVWNACWAWCHKLRGRCRWKRLPANFIPSICGLVIAVM